MTVLAFVDTETTGLDPDRHEIWEVALIVRRPTVLGDETVAVRQSGNPGASLISLGIKS